MSTQHADMPDNRSLYNCYTLDYTEKQARTHFERKFGQPPEKVFTLLGMLWVGPIPQKEEEA